MSEPKLHNPDPMLVYLVIVIANSKPRLTNSRDLFIIVVGEEYTDE